MKFGCASLALTLLFLVFTTSTVYGSERKSRSSAKSTTSTRVSKHSNPALNAFMANGGKPSSGGDNRAAGGRRPSGGRPNGSRPSQSRSSSSRPTSYHTARPTSYATGSGYSSGYGSTGYGGGSQMRGGGGSGAGAGRHPTSYRIVEEDMPSASEDWANRIWNSLTGPTPKPFYNPDGTSNYH